MDSIIPRLEIETQEGWRDFVEHVPYITFPADWAVAIIPPFCGAMARFVVKKGVGQVSVYLDSMNNLGLYSDAMGNPLPYWEVYPYKEDTFRCDMSNTDALLEAIEHSLNEQNAKAPKAPVVSKPDLDTMIEL